MATAATLAMANPAAAAQNQARGGDGAAGRPAAERAQAPAARGCWALHPRPRSPSSRGWRAQRAQAAATLQQVEGAAAARGGALSTDLNRKKEVY